MFRGAFSRCFLPCDEWHPDLAKRVASGCWGNAASCYGGKRNACIVFTLFCFSSSALSLAHVGLWFVPLFIGVTGTVATFATERWGRYYV